MRQIFLCVIFLFGAYLPFSSNAVAPPSVDTASEKLRVVRTFSPDDSVWRQMIVDESLYGERWDTLAQVRFWREIMKMAPDSSVVNIAHSRIPLGKVHTETWLSQTEPEKDVARDSIKKAHRLPDDYEIYVTYGRNEFYQFKAVIPAIDRAIGIFNKKQVNPWYAQAILLIESPGKLEYSVAGAYGPFQLMSHVARTVGLRVNREIDERADFDKSAEGAAAFLHQVCIPEAKNLARFAGLEADEEALWFRLLVLHVYHAGARNVRGAISQLGKIDHGKSLITGLWQVQYRGFKNASQNYSQVALAATLEMEDLLLARCLHYLE